MKSYRCNGCRFLHKKCSDDCPLRPCLAWIATAKSQTNATKFLCKHYGRTELFKLINASPSNLRPKTFRSLLYEACGRIVNPVYGSVGLLRSNHWDRCQSAVDAVLYGSPIRQFDFTDQAKMHQFMPLVGGDIRDLSGTDQSQRHRGRSEPDLVTEWGSELALFPTPGDDIGPSGVGKSNDEGAEEAGLLEVSWGLHVSTVVRSHT